MAETIEELTINYEDEFGVLVVKELEKAVLTKGAWTTVMYKFQEWNRTKEEYGMPKITIRRYKKSGGRYMQQSKFNISGAKQSHAIAEMLYKWFPKETEK